MLRSISKLALVGNPNSGKTTLFNALTGSRQRVANWPGVTVVRKEGYFSCAEHGFSVLDLPGSYSLTQVDQAAALDEQVTSRCLLDEPPDIIVNVINASHLERHLYLTMQLIEMAIPIVVVLNMSDEAMRRGRHVDRALLAERLGCPVVAMVASKSEGIAALKDALLQAQRQPPYPKPLPVCKALMQASDQIIADWPILQQKPYQVGRAACLRLLEGDHALRASMPAAVAAHVPAIEQALQAALTEDVDIDIADRRYRACSATAEAVLVRDKAPGVSWSARIDRWVLHRYLGIPIFLCMMYALFIVTMGLGSVFQDLFDWGSEAILVVGWGNVLQHWHVPAFWQWVLPQGVGRGMNTALAFVPVLFALFFSLSMLDQSGYMARAAMVVDRLMRRLGLPGKSFVPMIVGFGCNVPAVMATRGLAHQRERIVTMLMAPFMSCGARLAIFAVFVSAFFRHGGALVIFALYLIGIVVAVATGWLLHHTVLKGSSIPYVMELPPYRVPSMRRVLHEAGWRLRRFLSRALKVIVPVCVLLSVMGQVSLTGEKVELSMHNSALAQVGRSMTTVFAPMGVRQANWPATVALMTGVLAKEVVIGTLNSLYDQLHGIPVAGQTDQPDSEWHAQWVAAWRSVPANLAAFPRVFAHPLTSTAPMQRMDPASTSEMIGRFGGPVAAFSYMLFVLLYFPCISTVAAMVREMHRAWAYFSVAWSFVVAYVVAVLFYQTATVASHVGQTMLWWLAVVGIMALCFGGLRMVARFVPEGVLER